MEVPRGFTDEHHTFRLHGLGLRDGESSLTDYDRKSALSIIGLAMDGGSTPEDVVAMLRQEGFDIYRADEKRRMGSHDTGTGHFVSLWCNGSRVG